jgi:hypothetical protein
MAECKVRGVFSLSAYNQRGSSDNLKDYLIAKLLWNPYCDYDAIMNKYLSIYYGKAYPFMKEYYRAIEQRLKGILWVYDNPTDHSKDYLSEESITLYRTLFEQAFQAVKGQDLIEKRLRYDMISLLYVTLLAGYDAQNAAQNKKEFFDLCQEFEITGLNEYGMKPEYLLD